MADARGGEEREASSLTLGFWHEQLRKFTEIRKSGERHIVGEGRPNI